VSVDPTERGYEVSQAYGRSHLGEFCGVLAGYPLWIHDQTGYSGPVLRLDYLTFLTGKHSCAQNRQKFRIYKAFSRRSSCAPNSTVPATGFFGKTLANVDPTERGYGDPGFGGSGRDCACKKRIILTMDEDQTKTEEWFGIKGDIQYIPLWKWLQRPDIPGT
jgi:hypothetical protein